MVVYRRVDRCPQIGSGGAVFLRTQGKRPHEGEKQFSVQPHRVERTVRDRCMMNPHRVGDRDLAHWIEGLVEPEQFTLHAGDDTSSVMGKDLIGEKRDARRQPFVHDAGWECKYVKPRLRQNHELGDRRPIMSGDGVVLIAVNQQDVASTNQADVLLRLDPWTVSPPFEGHPTHSLHHLRMVHLPDGLLFEDGLDRRWFEHSGEVVEEVIFPSRHVAASGQASLTLHPIGTPHLDEGEIGPYGGHGGRAPPPSSRLAGWWKLLLERARNDPRVEGFDLSLEVTHHGPDLGVPCLFIEVGSTEATWGHVGAADVLAHIIRDTLLSEDDATKWSPARNAGETVVVTLGGGHYAPRANLLAAEEGIWLGHMLATYALPFEQNEGEVGGNWKQAINAAIDATRKSFPQGDLVCSMDKKAFKGWQRQAVRDHLDTLGIPLLTSKGVFERANKR